MFPNNDNNTQIVTLKICLNISITDIQLEILEMFTSRLSKCGIYSETFSLNR